MGRSSDILNFATHDKLSFLSPSYQREFVVAEEPVKDLLHLLLRPDQLEVFARLAPDRRGLDPADRSGGQVMEGGQRLLLVGPCVLFAAQDKWKRCISEPAPIIILHLDTHTHTHCHICGREV